MSLSGSRVPRRQPPSEVMAKVAWQSLTRSAIDSALDQHVSSVAADRADVLRVLEHPAVKEIASHAGVDLRRATSAVETAGAQQLSTMGAQARQVEQALAGGQSKVVISTTVIIIALLVLILLIVALD